MKNILVLIFIALGFGFPSLATASGPSAVIDDAVYAYNQLYNQLNSIPERRAGTPRSTQNVILQGAVVSGTSGIISAGVSHIRGPIPPIVLQSIATPLYEGNDIGVYLYNHVSPSTGRSQVQTVFVFYDSGSASVILMAVYTP